MTRFVLDASVTLSWILDNPVAVYAVRVKQELQGNARAVVPALWHAEVANGLAVAERRGILTAPDVDAGLKFLEQIVRQGIDTEDEIVPLRPALATARAYGLSAYDGIYLALARSLNLALATLDRALRTASVKAGVRLFQ